MDPIKEFQRANDLLAEKAYNEAAAIYHSLIQSHPVLAPLCDYRLATISNETGDPDTAYDLYYNAFTVKPDITSVLYPKNHPSHGYMFKGKKNEVTQIDCPACANEDLISKWCYPIVDTEYFNSLLNPVRLWGYCSSCHHVFARYYPDELFLLNNHARKTNPDFFCYYSDILARIARFTFGNSLFEVGIGASECLLAAQEMGYDVFGIDVIEKHVQMARDKFGLNAQTADVVEFKTDKKFDVIIMGDVLEHVSNPVLTMQKVKEILNDNGAIWVSTPNFDSAYSIFFGHEDTMRWQQYHLNYFSRVSFFSMLDKCGLAPVDYRISKHYTGSMEVIAVHKPG